MWDNRFIQLCTDNSNPANKKRQNNILIIKVATMHSSVFLDILS